VRPFPLNASMKSWESKGELRGWIFLIFLERPGFILGFLFSAIGR